MRIRTSARVLLFTVRRCNKLLLAIYFMRKFAKLADVYFFFLFCPPDEIFLTRENFPGALIKKPGRQRSR